jgi:hypothetical protein
VAVIEEAPAKNHKADSKTLNKLLGKKRRSKEITINVDGEELRLRFEAISAHDLDKLRAAHPATVTQKATGMAVNRETFEPALFAACLVDPEMTDEQALEMWSSPHWSTGELGYMFEICSNLCLEGIDIPRSASA